jgi:tripartite-type tricarboxylate transporter receptor subunit TctC
LHLPPDVIAWRNAPRDKPREERVRTSSRAALIAAAVMAVAGLAAAGAQAETYPSRAVTLVVPYTAGGGTDLFARLIAQKLEQRLGKPFIVENRPGSGAVVAATMVAHAPPDGHTLIMASSTPMALNVTVRKSLPYDPTVDLAPIALVARVPFVLLVQSGLPVHSVDDLVKLAKAKPGQLVYGSSGIGTFHHLNAELFKSTFGLDIVHVPYRGTLPTLNDLVGGHISMMFSDLPPALPLIQAGKVRALGVTTAQRVPAAPDIPPLAEVGIPGYDASSWQMVATQGKTPPEIIMLLNKEIREVMQDPSVQKDLIRDGAIPQVSPSSEELKAFVKAEIARWGKVVERAGIAGSE